MKKEQLLRVSCQENVYVGQPFKILVDFDFTHATRITCLTGIFEGRFRTAFANQVEYQQIIAFRIEFDALLRQWYTRQGKITAPAGHHRAESRIVIREHCPGTYFGKNGCIEYVVVVKMRVAGRIGSSELTQMCPVNVVPLVNLAHYMPFRMPVYIEKCFHKKLFCFNKCSVNIQLELRRAAFVRGMQIRESS
ncbi:unnamed protein product [Gongylonema pulchrum]|uniref:Arrestin_N domain-containing protein n=1 Tax=Gongylonema pulchrum TaxID=637853 RepID=A0A183CYE8_9BILA|nr:unnamed protein product [Gongylonema pulchrum]